MVPMWTGLHICATYIHHASIYGKKWPGINLSRKHSNILGFAAEHLRVPRQRLTSSICQWEAVAILRKPAPWSNLLEQCDKNLISHSTVVNRRDGSAPPPSPVCPLFLYLFRHGFQTQAYSQANPLSLSLSHKLNCAPRSSSGKDWHVCGVSPPALCFKTACHTM